MRRIGGLVLLVFLTGCASAAPRTIAAVQPAGTSTSTTTSIAVPLTTTAAPVTTATVPTTRAPATTVGTTRAPATTLATTRAPAIPTPTVPRTTATTVRPAGGGACNPNYAGACIPTGADVDCGEISAKNIRVVGTDVYRLDADGDGIGCESR